MPLQNTKGNTLLFIKAILKNKLDYVKSLN